MRASPTAGLSSYKRNLLVTSVWRGVFKQPEVPRMLNGETADCLALANTAILMRLLEELIERGLIAKPGVSALLRVQ